MHVEDSVVFSGRSAFLTLSYTPSDLYYFLQIQIYLNIF
jgi:hypothetical protein